MDYETAQKVENGEMPDDWYFSAETEQDLVACLQECLSCHTISKDADQGNRLYFFNHAGDAFFWTDEFLDEDCEIPNPDYHVEKFVSISDGVRRFKVNGKSVMDVVGGSRFTQDDIPMPPPALNAN